MMEIVLGAIVFLLVVIAELLWGILKALHRLEKRDL